VGNLSLSLNYYLGGLHVIGYHVVNILIHVVNAILLSFLVRSICRTPGFLIQKRSSEFVAFSAAFLFAVHPLQTQSVAYISQRVTSLATLFYLLSLLLYIRARMLDLRAEKSVSAQKTLYYGLALLTALLGIKAKEIAATLPVMIICVEFFCFRDRGSVAKNIIFPLIMAVLMALIYIDSQKAGRPVVAVLSSIDAVSKETYSLSRTGYLISQIRVIVTYLRLLFFPVNQVLDYDYPWATGFFTPAVLISFLLLCSLVWLAVWIFRRNRLMSLGIAWFFITLSVESSIIPIRDVINEQRTYLPSIGFLISAVSAIDMAAIKERLRISLVAVVVMLFSAGAYARNHVWTSAENLWSDVVEKAPYKARGYNNLGTVYKEGKEYARAIACFEQSLKLRSNFAAPYYNLGDIEYQLGNYGKAVEYLNRALGVGSKDKFMTIDVLNKLGRTYGAMGHTDKAIEYFQQGLTLYPDSFVLMNNLGVQYIKSDRPQRAVELYEKALRTREDYAMIVNLSVAYGMLGETEKSDRMKQRALDLRDGQ
jgi:tetratricopeptide (TPR) repeat protein